jgi:hypothetical protein
VLPAAGAAELEAVEAEEPEEGDDFSSLEDFDSPLGSEEDLEIPVAPTVDFLESLI